MSYQPTLCYHCFRERPEAPGPCPFCGYDPAAGREKYPLALPLGTILAGRYLLGAALGQGGFGITYVARDLAARELVAIKEYLPEGIALRTPGVTQVTALSTHQGENYRYGMTKFLEEAETLSRFNGHPNIVGVRSYFEENGTAYFAMEYLEGGSLKEYLAQQGGRIGWEQAWNLLAPVLAALEAVHGAQVVHRDISPDNIYLCRDGRVKLLDFGAARSNLGERSRSMSVILKQGYAPIEQYLRRGNVGPWTDLYAFCATFYRAVTGVLPPDAPSRMEEDELVPPSSLVNVPDYVEDALLKGLAVRAADRWQSAAGLRQALLGQAPAGNADGPAGQRDPDPTGQYGPSTTGPYSQNTTGPYGPNATGPHSQNTTGPYSQNTTGPYGPTPAADNGQRKKKTLLLKILAAACALVALASVVWVLAIPRDTEEPDSSLADQSQDEDTFVRPESESSVTVPVRDYAVGNTSGNLNNGGLIASGGSPLQVEGFAYVYQNRYDDRLYYLDKNDYIIYWEKDGEKIALYEPESTLYGMIVASDGLFLVESDEEGDYAVSLLPWKLDGVSLRNEKQALVSSYFYDTLFIREGAIYYLDGDKDFRRHDIATGEEKVLLEGCSMFQCVESDGVAYFIGTGAGAFSAIFSLDLSDPDAGIALVHEGGEDYMISCLNVWADTVYYVRTAREGGIYELRAYSIQDGKDHWLYSTADPEETLSKVNVLSYGNKLFAAFRIKGEDGSPDYYVMTPEDRIIGGATNVNLILRLPQDGLAAGRLGDTMRTRFFDFDAFSVDLYETLAGYTAAEGKMLLAIYTNVTNTQDGTLEMYDHDFELWWEGLEGPIYPLTESSSISNDGLLPTVYDLEPEESRSGVLLFEVDRNCSLVTLSYLERFQSGNTGDEFQVQIRLP